jgi:hypothetical protein
MEPAFARQLAGMLEHVCSDRQMMNRAIARVRKFQDKKFIEARLAETIRRAAFRAVHFLLLNQ